MSTTQIHQEAINQQDTIWIVPDELWERIQPELIIQKTRKKPGRPRMPDRPIFNGLIHLARTGGQWVALPREFGAKSTVFDLFTEWVHSRVFYVGSLMGGWRRICFGLDWISCVV